MTREEQTSAQASLAGARGAAADGAVPLLEGLGFKPFVPAARATIEALTGRSDTPPVLWGLSSLRILKPWVSLPTWLGRRRPDRRVRVYGLFNRDARPAGDGYSVRVTRGHDFRGGRCTYDSHFGTDFAAPVGTPVAAAAPGRVVDVRTRIEHGGRQVCVDHGRALFTVSCHLSRVLVREGEALARGEVLGLSGASGMEFLLCFPWVAPHLHVYVLLGGEPVDPFGRVEDGETPLWRAGNEPVPHQGPEDRDFEQTVFDPHAVEAGIQACTHAPTRARLNTITDPYRRGVELMLERTFRAPIFAAFLRITRGGVEREARLDLPFLERDFSGVAF